MQARHRSSAALNTGQHRSPGPLLLELPGLPSQLGHATHCPALPCFPAFPLPDLCLPCLHSHHPAQSIASVSFRNNPGPITREAARLLGIADILSCRDLLPGAALFLLWAEISSDSLGLLLRGQDHGIMHRKVGEDTGGAAVVLLEGAGKALPL